MYPPWILPNIRAGVTKSDCARSAALGWPQKNRCRSSCLPSWPQPWGWNVVINPSHPGFDRVVVAETVDVLWDPLVIRRGSGALEQRLHVGGGGERRPIDVVPAFEQRHDSSSAVVVRKVHRDARHAAEHVVGEIETTQ